MSKKIFISQPMNGRLNAEILQERAAVIRWAEDQLGETVEPLETFFDDFGPAAKPLDYLARSIEFLAKADVAGSRPAGRMRVVVALNTSALLTTESPSWRFNRWPAI